MSGLFIVNQLPLLPPVFTGFLPAPADLVVGFVMNLEPAALPPLGVLSPLLLFLLLVGKDIHVVF